MHLNFDYHDGRHLEAIALRVRSVGLIFAFGDQGCAETWVQDLMDVAEGHDLHPVQFAELQAQMWYAAHVRSRAYLYDFSFSGGVVRYRLPDNASNQMYAMYFDELGNEQYAAFLSAATGYPVQFLYDGGNFIVMPD